MSTINTRVVRRSQSLFTEWGEGYGPRFSYQEYMRVGRFLEPVQAGAASAGLALRMALCRNSATLFMLRRLSPRPGPGPSDRTMNRGFFRLHLVARAEDDRRIQVVLKDRGDPGNRVTAKILCEAALCLARDRGRLPGGPGRGGILTPATGLGMILLERLKRAGMKVEIKESL